MILGHGDIASVLPDHPDRIYFASGVSNSKKTDHRQFMRELELMLDQPRDKRLVYFSSLCVFYLDTPYARHKRAMEEEIKFRFPEYTIIRIGNITWGDNPNTIINYLRGQEERGEDVVLQDGYRYVVTLDEFLHWIGMIPNFNCEMNIPGERMTIEELYNRYVKP